MLAEQPQVAWPRHRRTGRLGLGIRGVVGLAVVRRAAATSGSFARIGIILVIRRIAIDDGALGCGQDAADLVGREPDRQQVDVASLLQARQRIAQQRLIPGRVLRDAVVRQAQGVFLGRGEMPQHDHRHLGDAERHRGFEPPVAGDKLARFIHQQRVCEAERQHAGFDLLQLLSRVQPGVAGVRTQFRDRAQHDLCGHPWEGHQGIRAELGVQTANSS